MRFASGYSKHCGRRINSCDFVTAFRKNTAQRTRTTTKVENAYATRSCQRHVEANVWPRRVGQVIQLRDLSILIIDMLLVASRSIVRLCLGKLLAKGAQPLIEAQCIIPKHSVSGIRHKIDSVQFHPELSYSPGK